VAWEVKIKNIFRFVVSVYDFLKEQVDGCLWIVAGRNLAYKKLDRIMGSASSATWIPAFAE